MKNSKYFESASKDVSETWKIIFGLLKSVDFCDNGSYFRFEINGFFMFYADFGVSFWKSVQMTPDLESEWKNTSHKCPQFLKLKKKYVNPFLSRFWFLENRFL